MTNKLQDYYDALERLKERGEKITNDSVSIEAGRGKGSIKKSRLQFKDLIQAIDAAALEVADKQAESGSEDKLRTEIKRLEVLLDQALGREISLAHEVFRLKAEIKAMTKGKVVHLK